MNNTLTLYQITDLHYISPEFIDNGAATFDLMKNTDGKLIHYISQITDAIIDEIIKVRPHAFILSGDLTYNGERESHIRIARLLKKILEEEIPVLVIPGNHDIDNKRAYSFRQGNILPVQNISQDDFFNIYYDMGYSKALSVDNHSLSYCYSLTDDTWIMMLDASKDKGYASNLPNISEESLEWIEKCLMRAKEQQVTVMSVTHQNILEHNQLFSLRCTVGNGERLIQLYQKYGVTFNIGGHMHIQHISYNKESNFYDVATNSVLVYPNYAGIIKIATKQDGKKTFAYHNKIIGMESYAREQGIADSNLLEFKQYSRKFFYQNCYNQIKESLSEIELTQEEEKIMVSFAVSKNLEYFAGILDTSQENWFESKEYRLWKEKASSTFYYGYLSEILKEKSCCNKEINNH